MADLSCHGGVTYGAPCDEGGPICHVPLPGEPAEVFWIGFDCAHANDHCPGFGFPISYGTYRNLEYVKEAVEQLADQIAEITPEPVTPAKEDLECTTNDVADAEPESRAAARSVR